MTGLSTRTSSAASPADVAPSGHATARGSGVLISLPWDQAFGGVTSVARHLARYLDERGHRPLMLLPGASVVPRAGRAQAGYPAYFQALRQPVVPGHALKSGAAFLAYLPAALGQLARLVRRERVGVVNVHYPGPNAVYFALLRRALPIRLVTSVHGSDVIPEDGPMRRVPVGMRMLFDASDAIVAPSAAFREAFLADFPRYAAKTVVVWNGIDLDALERRARDEDPAVAAECAAITGGAPFALTVADQTPKKALDVLVRAFPAVLARHPSLALVLVGDPRLQDELRALAASLGVAERVRIVGRRPPAVVARLLREARVFALPSRQEPFGIAAVEALALGTPTVVTAVEGLREVVRDGETGLTVPPEDPAALAAAMLRLLDDPALRERVAEAGRADARRRFDWRAMGAAYLRDGLGIGDPERAPRARSGSAGSPGPGTVRDGGMVRGGPTRQCCAGLSTRSSSPGCPRGIAPRSRGGRGSRRYPRRSAGQPPPPVRAPCLPTNSRTCGRSRIAPPGSRRTAAPRWRRRRGAPGSPSPPAPGVPAPMSRRRRPPPPPRTSTGRSRAGSPGPPARSG